MNALLPPYGLIADGLRRGLVIPFLGAGASLGNRQPGMEWDENQQFLPKGTELASRLAKLTEFPEEPRELTKVAQYYYVVAGRTSLHRELHAIFNKDYSPTRLHTYLAEVSSQRPMLIVTTNYDDLMEQSCQVVSRRDGRYRYDVVVHTTDPAMVEKLLWWPYGSDEPELGIPNKLDIDLRQATVIYKMHGAVDRLDQARDQYVITEDDYIDFLVRMTTNTALPAMLAEPFQNRHFLFLGYGLGDWNLRVVLNRVDKARLPKAIRSWAVQYQAKPLERRFWQERGVEVYDMTLDDFVTELAKH